MSDVCCEEFQRTVGQYLIRHRSILDVLSKNQEACARINRALAKAVTSCGCISLEAHKPELPNDISYPEIKEYMDTHLRGQLCDNCSEILETEIGRALFYTAAICELLGLNLAEVIEKEQKQLAALGVYNLT